MSLDDALACQGCGFRVAESMISDFRFVSQVGYCQSCWYQLSRSQQAEINYALAQKKELAEADLLLLPKIRQNLARLHSELLEMGDE